MAAESNWLTAFNDPLATLYTFGSCMSLTDLTGDGDVKLIVADLGTGQYNMKVKVYKGTTVMAEEALVDLPTAIVPLFTDLLHPRVPALAIASGASVFVYKNLRPFYKFTLPSEDVVSIEREIWDAASSGKLTASMLAEALQNIKTQVPVNSLTSRTHKFLTLTDNLTMEQFLELHNKQPLLRQSVVTCLCSLKKNSQEPDAIDALVVGTESGKVHILETEAFTVISTANLRSPPICMVATGLLDVEYRLLVCCRNGEIYTLKRSVTDAANATIELNCPPLGMIRVGKTIIAACMDSTLRCYNLKGKKLWSLTMPDNITAIEAMDYQPRNYTGVIVGLANSEVHIYRDVYLVDHFKLDNAATGIRFGAFGRELGALVLSLKNGGLIVRLLKRSAKFDEKSSLPGPPAAQGQKLSLPKKTKVYVDQTLREQEQAVQMHQAFQRDMFMLKLHTAKMFSTTLKNVSQPISVKNDEMVKVTANVQGFGPTFMLNVSVQVVGSQALQDVIIFFVYNPQLYAFEKESINASFLVPSIEYPFDTKIKCLDTTGISEDIKVLVVRADSNRPLVTAIITMPVPEQPIID